MRWTIMLQCDDGAGDVRNAEVLTLERDVEPAFSMLGLLHREAKLLLLRLQQRFVRQQAAAYSRHIRPCPKCGIERNIKDYRPRTLRSLFGNIVMRIPRYHRCICEQIASGRLLRYIWPGTKLLPTGNTPELIAMHASLGARMPYREAAFLLSGLLPRQRRCSHSTVRNHTLQVGARLDFEGLDRAVKAASCGIDWASVAIDGTYARGRRSEGCHRFHIVAGRFEPLDGKATLFSFVQRFQPPRGRMSELWQALGCRKSTHLRVLTDGDRGMSHFVQASALGTSGHVLDWFHIAMRLQAIRRSLGMSLRRAGYSRKNTRLEERQLESIRHHLWHGDIDLGCELLGTMRNRIEAVAASKRHGNSDWLEQNLRQMHELWQYLLANKDEAVCYSREHRAGQRVTTAPVESTINRLVNHRMNKRQQMSWSQAGAHYLLQVRTAILNGQLGNILARWYPGFGSQTINVASV